MYEKAEQIIESLTEDQREALKDWVRLDSRHAVAAGGIGQNREEMAEASEAWEALEEDTRHAYRKLLSLHAFYAQAAIREAKEATGEEMEPEDALGDDYPLNDYISAQDF